MTEINNIPNFGRKIEKIEKNINKETPASKTTEEDVKKQEYVQDTGVLGRSQVKSTNVSTSVDEAVKLSETNPAVLNCSEGVHNSLYRSFLESGIEPSEAYMKALFAEQEFLDIVKDC